MERSALLPSAQVFVEAGTLWIQSFQKNEPLSLGELAVLFARLPKELSKKPPMRQEFVTRQHVPSLYQRHEHDVYDAFALFGMTVAFCRRTNLDAALRFACRVDRESGRTSRREESFGIQDELTECLILDSRAASTIENLRLLLARCDLILPREDELTEEEVTKVTIDLSKRGYLAPQLGKIDFGDLLRMRPICMYFGFTRGTPVDRYYLRDFILSNRPRIQGKVLEIGGRSENVSLYRLKDITTYHTVDLVPSADVDIVADVQEPSAFDENSYDNILIFNVLEHCPFPNLVTKNIYRWLRPGGSVFALVPCCQRVHEGPKDFARILPDGLGELFAAFDKVAITTYGSLPTCLAALQGIPAEEVPSALLDVSDPLYPVTGCVSARKHQHGT